MATAKPSKKGVVDMESMKGKTPDSVRIHPYNPSQHAASKYEMEPETRPQDYKPTKNIYFNMAKRKMYMLLLGLVVGCVVIGIFLAVILGISKSHSHPVLTTPMTDEVSSLPAIR